MLSLIYRIFLTFNATCLIIIIFLIKAKYQLCVLLEYTEWISYIIYMLFPIILTGISIELSKILSHDDIKGNIRDVEQASNVFLPSYLGYFFVALSVQSVETLFFIFIILFMFTFFSQTLYFNPIFLFYGYQFYYITTESNTKLLIISKKQIRSTSGLEFKMLRRINDFTYIDEEE